MNTTTEEHVRMTVAKLVWDGMPVDPLEFAEECPQCGELPNWEHDGEWSYRWRLNCCNINSHGKGHRNGHDIDAVIDWNEAAEWERQVIEWSKEEAKRERQHEEEDRWVDEHLPMPA